MNTNDTYNACDIYRVGCSHSQGHLQKEYLVRNSPPGTYLGSSISGATRRDGKVKERENKAPVPEDGGSAGETQQIHNLGLNFKNQRLASRSHNHPSTMCPGIFLNTL